MDFCGDVCPPDPNADKETVNLDERISHDGGSCAPGRPVGYRTGPNKCRHARA